MEYLEIVTWYIVNEDWQINQLRMYLPYFETFVEQQWKIEFIIARSSLKFWLYLNESITNSSYQFPHAY